MLFVKKVTYIVLLFLLGVLSISIVRRVGPAREPVYHGEPLNAWLEDLNSTSLYTQDTAKAAIREMGTNAVPALLQMLQSNDSQLRLRLLELVGKQSLVRFSDGERTSLPCDHRMSRPWTTGPTDHPRADRFFEQPRDSQRSRVFTCRHR